MVIGIEYRGVYIRWLNVMPTFLYHHETPLERWAEERLNALANTIYPDRGEYLVDCAIRQIVKRECQWCGSTERLVCHHIHGRHPARVCWILCHRCNITLGHHGDNPEAPLKSYLERWNRTHHLCPVCYRGPDEQYLEFIQLSYEEQKEIRNTRQLGPCDKCVESRERKTAFLKKITELEPYNLGVNIHDGPGDYQGLGPSERWCECCLVWSTGSKADDHFKGRKHQHKMQLNLDNRHVTCPDDEQCVWCSNCTLCEGHENWCCGDC